MGEGLIEFFSNKKMFILVTIVVNDFIRLKMVLDTRASHTTIDSNALYIADYDLKDVLGVVDIETANGQQFPMWHIPCFLMGERMKRI